MPSYIYYEASYPPDIQIVADKFEHQVRDLRNNNSLVISENKHNGRDVKNIIYFDSRQELDSHLNSNWSFISLISSNSEVIKYCEDNNITYSVSINDTDYSLTDLIESIDKDNFAYWCLV